MCMNYLHWSDIQILMTLTFRFPSYLIVCRDRCSHSVASSSSLFVNVPRCSWLQNRIKCTARVVVVVVVVGVRIRCKGREQQSDCESQIQICANVLLSWNSIKFNSFPLENIMPQSMQSCSFQGDKFHMMEWLDCSWGTQQPSSTLPALLNIYCIHSAPGATGLLAAQRTAHVVMTMVVAVKEIFRQRRKKEEWVCHC